MNALNPDREQQQVNKLLAELTHGPVALSSAPETDARRARLLPTLRQQVSLIPLRRSQRETLRRRATWVLAAAAVVVSGVGAGRWLTLASTAQAQLLLVQPRGNAVELVDRGQHRTLTEAMSIAASGQLEATQSAALTTVEGVLVELAARTRVGLDELNPKAGWRLHLRQGHVACEVPKLTGQKSFSVVTKQAEVIVHGTRFTVTSDDAATCVRVTEGRVEVRSSSGAPAFLNPGQAWGCDQTPSSLEPASAIAAKPADVVAPEPGSASAPAKDENPEHPRATGRTESKPAVTPPLSTGSTLAHETTLVGRALSAERRGDDATARRLYTDFLERYPNSPIAPEARRGLKRVSLVE